MGVVNPIFKSDKCMTNGIYILLGTKTGLKTTEGPLHFLNRLPHRHVPDPDLRYWEQPIHGINLYCNELIKVGIAPV